VRSQLAIRIVLSFLCILPSAWVNARAQISMGAGYDIVATVVLFAIMAPAFTLYAARLYENGKRIPSIAWGALAAVFIVMNALIALGGISTIRDMASDRNAGAMRATALRNEAMKAMNDRLKVLRAAIGNSTSQQLEADLSALTNSPLYTRSLRCENATVAESQALCQSIARVTANMKMAREAEGIERRKQSQAWQTSTVTITPHTKDSQIANIQALSALVLSIPPDHRLLSAILSVVMAVMLELSADLGPVVVWGLIKLTGHDRVRDRFDRSDRGAVKPVMTPCQTAKTGRGSPVIDKHRMNVVPFTPVTRETVSQMRLSGMSWKVIADRLAVSESTARRRMKLEVELKTSHADSCLSG
jgi:hypothetical protein